MGPNISSAPAACSGRRPTPRLTSDSGLLQANRDDIGKKHQNTAQAGKGIAAWPRSASGIGGSAEVARVLVGKLQRPEIALEVGEHHVQPVRSRSHPTNAEELHVGRGVVVECGEGFA